MDEDVFTGHPGYLRRDASLLVVAGNLLGLQRISR